MPPEKGGGGLRGERGGRLVYYAERSYNIGWFGIFFCSVLLIVWAAVLTDPTYAQQQQQQKQLQYYQSESQQQEYQPEAQPQQPSQQQQLLAYTNLDRTVQLASDRSRYDSADLSAAEVQGSAVSAFCKSFSFLCHIRCLQRGDPRDAGNVGPNNCGSTSPGTDSRGGGEINRCAFVSGSSSVRVLCVCNNGVDLTAEVDYALEGVVDNGQGDAGAGEAGRIREVAYLTRTVTVTRTKTLPAVTRTTTLTKVVWSSTTTFTTTTTATITVTVTATNI